MGQGASERQTCMQMELTRKVLLREKEWKGGRGEKRWPLRTGREERDTEKDKEEEEREVG